MILRYLIFATLFIYSGTAFAAPQIFVDKSTYAFGSVIQGKKVDHTFVIKNIGDSPLKIVNIRPACGCTAAKATVPVVPPGKTSEIKVSFNSSNFSGAVVKTIAVETNDHQNPVYTLTLTGTIIEEVALTPKQLNLGQVKTDIPRVFTLSLENRGSKPLRLISVRTPMPQVTLKTDKTMLNPGEKAVIALTVTPRSEDRILSGYLSIVTDNPSKHEIMVPIYGSISR